MLQCAVKGGNSNTFHWAAGRPSNLLSLRHTHHSGEGRVAGVGEGVGGSGGSGGGRCLLLRGSSHDGPQLMSHNCSRGKKYFSPPQSPRFVPERCPAARDEMFLITSANINRKTHTHKKKKKRRKKSSNASARRLPSSPQTPLEADGNEFAYILQCKRRTL